MMYNLANLIEENLNLLLWYKLVQLLFVLIIVKLFLMNSQLLLCFTG